MDYPGKGEIKDRIHQLLAQMAELQNELEEELGELEDEFHESVERTRDYVEHELHATEARVRLGLRMWFGQSEPRNVLSAPLIYSMIVPIALLDLSFSLYQAICFRLYGISRVDRTKHIAIDRHRLPYLNLVEKLNCSYCGYANGVLSYACEIAARTEQYWCPIKHARRRLGEHARYVKFLDYGDETGLDDEQARLRAELGRDDSTEIA